MNDYVADFKLLPTSIVTGFDDPNDQIAMLKKLITDCIADHVPIKKVKFTHPPGSMDAGFSASYSKETPGAFTKSELR